MITLEELVSRVNAAFGLEIDRTTLLGFLSKRLTASSSLAIQRAGHGYHIEITDPRGPMLVFPVVTSAAYLAEHAPGAPPVDDPTREKRRYTLQLDLRIYRTNLIALAERMLADHDGGLRYDAAFYEELARGLDAADGDTIAATTECRFAIRGTGQLQLEIGAASDGANFIDLRKCLLPDDYLVFLQTGPGTYDVLGVPAEVANGDWEGWAAAAPGGTEIRGSRVRPIALDAGATFGETEYGDATEDMITAVVRTCQIYGDRSIIALAGVPGTGKSYVAGIAAERIAGNRVREIQFHQSFSYEEFIEGLRLEAGGAVRERRGIFLEANEAALDDPDQKHVLLIEELTRANISAVLGELMTYVEHRERYFTTLYERRRVRVAPNLVILATYNPSDRSAIDVDDALLRRLRIVTCEPSGAQLREMLQGSMLGEPAIARLVRLFEACKELPNQHLMPFGHGIFAGVKDQRPDLNQLWVERIQHMLWRPLVAPNPFAETIRANYPWTDKTFEEAAVPQGIPSEASQVSDTLQGAPSLASDDAAAAVAENVVDRDEHLNPATSRG